MQSYDELWKEAVSNQAKLDACDKHAFVWPVDPANYVEIGGERRLAVGSKIVCAKCNGQMKALLAMQYVMGYKAAGGNPNDVMPGWDSEAG